MRGYRWLFDLGAEAYDLLTWQDTWMAHSASMAAHFPPGAEALDILDVGVGPGVSAVGLARRLPSARIVGLDLSRRMLRRARRRVDPGIALLQADITRLPFEDASFDVVTGHSFLYLLPDQRGAMKEIARVLRPGGTCVFLEPRDKGPITTAFTIDGCLRFKLCMILWRIVSATAGRFDAERLVELLETELTGAEAIETLQGLGWFGVARKPLPDQSRAPSA
jgi:ubiquinone/menaquinone biosynthesis C-methylase UbiE